MTKITRRKFILTAAAAATGLAIGAFRAETPAPVVDVQAVPLGEQPFTGSMSEAFAGQSGTMMAWAPPVDTYAQKVLSTEPILYWQEPTGVMRVAREE